MNQEWDSSFSASGLGIKNLSPSYCTMVMATGIVSIGAYAMGFPVIARVLLWLNFSLFISLCLLSVMRSFCFTDCFLKDLLDYQRGPGFFSVVAALSILGFQFMVLLNDYALASLLWATSTAAWLVVNYVIFLTFTIKDHDEPLTRGINGNWLLAVVAPQAIAVLSALLAAHWRPEYGLEFNFMALAIWLVAGMLYIWLTVLIFYRYIFFGFSANDLAHWNNVGAMAISVFAGSLLIMNAATTPYMHSLLPFLKGFTLLYWATGTWWIPLLIVLEIWRHTQKHYPLRYEPRYWGAAFSLGMYSVGTWEMAKTMNLPFLHGISIVFLYLAMLAWIATAIGLIVALGKDLRQWINKRAPAHRRFAP